MKTQPQNFQGTIKNVGWSADIDDNYHPLIEFEVKGKIYTIYNHPTNGWEFSPEDSGTDDAFAPSTPPREIVRKGHELDWNYNLLDDLADDLRRLGWEGATNEWRNQTVTLGYISKVKKGKR